MAESYLPDYGAFVEEATRSLTRGMIAFDPVREMLVSETYRVEARISISETAENLTKGFIEGEVAEIEEIPVSTFMKVRLTGTAFEISPMTDERQLITREGHRTWFWDVIPQKSGTHELTLSAFAEVALPGQEPMPVDTQVFSSPIVISARKIPLTVKVENFLTENWEFIVGTLILGSGLSKWLMDRIRSRSRRNGRRPSEGGEEGGASEAEVAEIDFAALEEGAVGLTDLKGSDESRPAALPGEDIDFAAFEAAVIGRTDLESGEVGVDRFEEDRPERGSGPEEAKRPEGSEERKEAKGSGMMTRRETSIGSRPGRRRKISWTVVKADQTREVDPEEEREGEDALEDKSRGKTAQKGENVVKTGSEETRITSDLEEGMKLAGGIKPDKTVRRRSRRNKTENEYKVERKFRKRSKR